MNGARPSLAVVIPAFNVERWVEETLVSALGQTPGPDEVIVVNDGSTDRTAEILARFRSEIRVVTQQNRGLAAARNAGAASSTTDAILFLDADDLLLPGALNTATERLMEFPEAAVLDPQVESQFPDGRVVRPPAGDARTYRRKDVGTVIVRNPFVANAVVRRGTWERHPYDERLRYCEDLDLWLRLLLDDLPIVRLGDILIRRREAREGAMTSVPEHFRRCRRDLFVRTWQRSGLTPLERCTLAYGIARTSVGLAQIRLSRSRGDR